ncbi:FkbM family methyltransferase [Haloferax namakaokahaiae]|uniref:FkbM family methyltransferase n=1 Tax=Haloferax namakaokahaiae TaxID=1748331 RepID=A0ABD5ZH30_9EURY
MLPRHPLSTLRHLSYSLHYALVRRNYRHELFTTTKYVDGVSFRSYELYNRHGEDVLLHALLSNLSPGDVVIDVGANTGTYTLAAAASDPSVRVVAVEPNARVADQLTSNIRLNEFENRVTHLACGIGNADETRTFHQSSYDELGSFSVAHASAWEASVEERVELQMRRLDSLVESGEVPPPDHIKIDVEGFGMEVLEGATSVLERHQPTIYFEVHDARDGHDESAAAAVLRERGYRLIPVREGWVCEPRES